MEERRNTNPRKEKTQEIYRRLELFMKSRGISQSEFAKTLGISSGNVGDWKRGKSAPGVGVLIEIAKRFGISLDWLILGKTDGAAGVREEGGVYFFDDRWQLHCQIDELDEQECAFIKEYLEFTQYRKRHKKS